MIGTIAVVDDDNDVREILTVLLETAGHAVREYPSGKALLSDNDIGQIDRVVIDQRMPGLSGTDVLLEIDRCKLALPSVLITEAMDPEVTAAAERLGTMTVMIKPSHGDELLSFVEAAVG